MRKEKFYAKTILTASILVVSLEFSFTARTRRQIISEDESKTSYNEMCHASNSTLSQCIRLNLCLSLLQSTGKVRWKYCGFEGGQTMVCCPEPTMVVPPDSPDIQTTGRATRRPTIDFGDGSGYDGRPISIQGHPPISFKPLLEKYYPKIYDKNWIDPRVSEPFDISKHLENLRPMNPPKLLPDDFFDNFKVKMKQDIGQELDGIRDSSSNNPIKSIVKVVAHCGGVILIGMGVRKLIWGRNNSEVIPPEQKKEEEETI